MMSILASSTARRVANAVLFAFVAWGATRVYALYCAPAGFYGFLQSFITMDSTLCKVVFAIISHTQILYGAALATLFYAFMNLFRSKTPLPIPTLRPATHHLSDSEPESDADEADADADADADAKANSKPLS